MYRQLGICDVEAVYLKRLAAYLNRKSEISWRIKTYTELDLCLRERLDVMLVSGAALEKWYMKKNSSMMPEMIGCQIIFLEDGKNNPEKWPVVKKYQAAGKLYEDLLEILAADIVLKTEVIGVYGPANGPGAETLARKIGLEYSDKGEVLIIPLTEYPVLFHEVPDGNGIGEWFYYYSQNGKEKLRLSDWVFTEERLNYLHGFRTIYDQRGLKLSDWKDFFKEGLKKSRYSTVILVFDRIPDYLELFMWCDLLYVQWGQDGYGDLRKQKFEKMTTYMEMNELINKLIEQ